MGGSLPLISVIIPVANRIRYLKQAVESVIAQHYPHTEIIVIDDGSGQNIPAILDSLERRVKYLWKSNGGVASARNLGISCSQGDFLLFLDEDDFLEREALACLVDAITCIPTCMWVAGRFHYVDHQGQRISRVHKKNHVSGDIYKQMIIGNLFGAPSTVLIRRQALVTVGLFDETLPPAEDYDLWLRLAREYEIQFIPEAVTNYRIHRTNATRLQWSKHYEMLIRVMEKNRLTARPGCERLFDRGLARLHGEYGDELYVHNLFSTARAEWNKAIRLSETKVRMPLYLRWLKSCVPPRLVPIGRRLCSGIRATREAFARMTGKC